MTLQTIESQDLTLGKLFSDFYAVPSFQREYVWQETQVEQLLQDIYDEFSSDGRTEGSEYFIGSIVVCARPDSVFDLIDGQQRMTTSYLVLCAIRDRLKAIAPDAPIDALANQIAAADIDSAGRDVFRYKVMLQYEDSHDVLESVARQIDVDTIPLSTRSVRNIISAYHAISAFLRTYFDEDADGLRKFYAFFTRNVKLIRVKTISLTHALKVFETINDRGMGLDAMDLLKNLLFMRARSQDFDKLKDKWKELVDVLYKAGEKPLRFLRYFIMARYRVDRLREDGIYKWFVDNEQLCGIRTQPLQFVGELLSDARAYAHFIGGRDSAGTHNRYLTNISYLSGAARQHFILLLAARDWPAPLFTELCRHIEDLFFAYIITREPTKEFEYRFAQWSEEVRSVTSQQGLDAFVARRIQPAKETLAPRFELAFRGLEEYALQKYRLRYVLAKLAQYVDERAWGSEGPAASLATYINGKVEIEHILPQSPSAAVRAEFDRPEEIYRNIHRLGNFTLVEKSINCSVGNGLFSAKAQAYRQSNFLLTKSLGEHVQVGLNTAVDRAVQELEDFEEWSSSAIERRQAMLLRIARSVWDMPAPSHSAEASTERTA